MRRLFRERTYPTWEAAKAASAGAYSDDLVNRFRVSRSALRQHDGGALAQSLLYLTALTLNNRGLCVTDLGGAAGDVGMEFLSAFPQAAYTVVENETMVRLADNGAVRFATTIPSACDIFFSSGTLQYLDDPAAAVAAAFASARSAVVLARNAVRPGGDLSRPAVIPVR